LRDGEQQTKRVEWHSNAMAYAMHILDGKDTVKYLQFTATGIYNKNELFSLPKNEGIEEAFRIALQTKIDETSLNKGVLTIKKLTPA
jgi:hypothetical protein